MLLNVGLYLFYIMAIAGVLGMIGFSIVNAMNNPGAFMKSGIAVGALLVIFAICYAVSSDEVSAKHAAFGVTGTGAKFIGAGLMMFYISFVLAILALIYSEVTKAVK